MYINGKVPDRPPRNKAELAAIILLVVFFGGMVGFALFEDFTVYKLSVPFFIASWVILLIIHEFGHALMARALGWRVELVSIGSGRLVFTKRILGMKTEFRAIPLSGFAVPRPTDLIQPQFKNFLIYAAGPGIELALVAAVWLLLGQALLQKQPSITLILIQSFCIAATFGALVNLVPLPFNTDDGKKAWSDGLGMIMSWRLPTAYFAELLPSREAFKNK